MSKEKSEQLGMNFSTAQHQLRKRIMFDLLQRLEEDFCFKCGAQIETVEELSIEHKEPWLHVNPDLFWSLDNIAFSHRECNTVDRQYRKYPVGMKKCTQCGEVKDKEKDFHKRTHRCKPCNVLHMRRKRSSSSLAER